MMTYGSPGRTSPTHGKARSTRNEYAADGEAPSLISHGRRTCACRLIGERTLPTSFAGNSSD
jgi:hypothetical protein